MMGLLGDVLMRTPLIKELKNLYPNAKIIVIVDPIGKEVLQNNPDIYEIIVLNRSKKNIFKYLYGKIEIQIKMIMKSLFLIINASLPGTSKDSQNLLNRLFWVYLSLSFS